MEIIPLGREWSTKNLGFASQKSAGCSNNKEILYMDTYLQFNIAKARAFGKVRRKAFHSVATETHAFKTSPLGIIIGDGLDLDA